VGRSREMTRQIGREVDLREELINFQRVSCSAHDTSDYICSAQHPLNSVRQIRTLPTAYLDVKPARKISPQPDPARCRYASRSIRRSSCSCGWWMQ
jgi:hypothetical protein